MECLHSTHGQLACCYRAVRPVSAPVCAVMAYSCQTPPLVASRGMARSHRQGPSPRPQSVSLSRPNSTTNAEQRRSRIRVHAAPAPYPFNEADYLRVEFVPAPYGPMLVSQEVKGTCQGVILFQEAGLPPSSSPEDVPVMQVFVAGDSAMSVYHQFTNTSTNRPMSLDLLWQMWERGQAISKREWTLVRSAIVALSNDVYEARLFFGDPETQEVVWDCDCRPSDATYLANKVQAPMYISRDVWEKSANPLRESEAYKVVTYAQQLQRQQEQQSQRLAAARSAANAAGALANFTPSMDVAAAARSLPCIELLVRELEVAVHEENYAEAARLRDHPFIRLCQEIDINGKIGYAAEAQRLYEELLRLVQESESRGEVDYETRLTQAQAQVKQQQQQGPQSVQEITEQGLHNETTRD